MFTAAKDLMASQAAKAYLNNFISRYGKVQELTIDSKNQRIEVVCQLNGEVAPIAVTIVKYRMEAEGTKKFFTIVDSSASRPWLQGVIRDFGHGRRFEVPGFAAAAL
ncbi:MAG: hypothetical protein ABIZ49_00925 [Opitutaceae bacterium]